MISVHREIDGVRNQVYRHIKKKINVTLVWGIIYENDEIIKFHMIDDIHFEVQNNIDDT